MRTVAAKVAKSGPFRPGAVRRIPLGIARGLRLEVNPGTTMHVYLGSGEIELARHVRRLAAPGTRCFDVGSSEGYYALLLARLTGVEVIAFEFQAEHVARLRRNLARNPAVQVRIVESYVADITDPSQHVDTLDRMIAADALPQPGLLKIDVEGAEAGVLRGAAELLDRRRPHVIVETHGVGIEAECLDLLRGHGYQPLVVDQRRWFREGRPNPHNRWLVAEGRV